jgi:hypothetical protein
VPGRRGGPVGDKQGGRGRQEVVIDCGTCGHDGTMKFAFANEYFQNGIREAVNGKQGSQGKQVVIACGTCGQCNCFLAVELPE